MQLPIPVSREPEQKKSGFVYDPEPRLDWVRAAIAAALLSAFLAIIAFALYSTRASAEVYTRTKDLLDKLLPALTGLIGSALGFYFGSRTERR
jgi:hypothetical protein